MNRDTNAAINIAKVCCSKINKEFKLPDAFNRSLGQNQQYEPSFMPTLFHVRKWSPHTANGFIDFTKINDVDTFTSAVKDIQHRIKERESVPGKTSRRRSVKRGNQNSRVQKNPDSRKANEIAQWAQRSGARRRRRVNGRLSPA
jgi:hypothetical protein